MGKPSSPVLLRRDECKETTCFNVAFRFLADSNSGCTL